MAHPITTAPGAQTAGVQRLAKRLGLTVRPETFGERFRNSAAVWLALMAYWALSSVMLAVFPPSGRPLPPFGAVLHLGTTLVGLAAIWCMHRSSFPAAWDTRIPARSYKRVAPVRLSESTESRARVAPRRRSSANACWSSASPRPR